MKICITYLSEKYIIGLLTTYTFIEPDTKKTTEEVDEDNGDDFLLDYQPVQEDPVEILSYITSESQEGKDVSLLIAMK